MKPARRKVVTLPHASVDTWGPHIVAQLARGEVVEVAGFVLKLQSAATVQQPLELRPQ